MSNQAGTSPRHLYLWVLLAIIAGGLIGHFLPETGVA